MKKLNSDFFRNFYSFTILSLLFISFSGKIIAQGNCDNDTIAPTFVNADIVNAGVFKRLNLTEVPARYFDRDYLPHKLISSFDNCSSRENLVFSYSVNPDDTIRTVEYLNDIAYTDSMDINIFLFDENGNYDVKRTKIFTDAPNTKNINFKIDNFTGINQDYLDYYCDMMESYILDNNGDTVPSWKSYGNNSNICPLNVITSNHPFPYIIYSKFVGDDFLNGVTTLDIVIALRNILENRKLPVCDIITMDINNDLNASVTDIVLLYNDVLGLSNNTDNIWMAYDKKLDTPKPFFPLQIENIPDTAIEFTLIKKLDLGYPHNYSIFCDTIDILNNEYRNNYLSNDIVVLDIVNTGNVANVHSFEIQYNGDKPIHGFQISMQFDNNNVEDIKVYNQQGQELENHEYIVLNNEVRILALSPRGILNNLSYTVKVISKNINIEDLKYLIDFNKNPLRLEATDEQFNSTPLKFNFTTKPNANKELTYDDIAINPNPFTGNLYISLDNSTDNIKKIVVYKLLGKMIFEKNYKLNMQKEIIIPSNVFPDKGIYLIEINTGQTKVVKKVIKN